MKDERIMILKMIEDGKISADDGVKLIKALHNVEGSETVKKVVKNIDGFAKDMKDKITEMAKDAEPKVKHATKVVVEKTGVVVDELGKNLKEIINNRSEKGGCTCKDCNNDEDAIVYEAEFDEYVEDDDVIIKASDVVDDVIIIPVVSVEETPEIDEEK